MNSIAGMPWFRFYNECVRDRRFLWIARETGQPNCNVMGIWAYLLCVANDCNQDGYLFINYGEDFNLRVMTDLDVAANMEIAPELAKELLGWFCKIQLLANEQGAYLIPDWNRYKAPDYLSCYDELRQFIMERDGFRCQYCGRRAEHVDHIIPRCQGGTDDIENLVAACASCNLSKGGRTPKEAGMRLL